MWGEKLKDMELHKGMVRVPEDCTFEAKLCKSAGAHNAGFASDIQGTSLEELCAPVVLLALTARLLASVFGSCFVCKSVNGNLMKRCSVSTW